MTRPFLSSQLSIFFQQIKWKIVIWIVEKILSVTNYHQLNFAMGPAVQDQEDEQRVNCEENKTFAHRAKKFSDLVAELAQFWICTIPCLQLAILVSSIKLLLWN